MTMHTFALTSGRINKYKGQILSHAVPMEVLGRTGRQVPMPKNSSDTYVARRFLPYGATATSSSTMNQFFANGTGDRAATLVQAHLVQEGVTAAPDARSLPSRTPQARAAGVAARPLGGGETGSPQSIIIVTVSAGAKGVTSGALVFAASSRNSPMTFMAKSSRC
jgi:hypothetical protein